jgi:phosphoribosylanthranilate isomerase
MFLGVGSIFGRYEAKFVRWSQVSYVAPICYPQAVVVRAHIGAEFWYSETRRTIPASVAEFQMHRTRVKICGITRAEDALATAQLGADALGLVFYPKSSRLVTVARAKGILRVLPPFVTVVGLFRNATAEAVRGILRELPLDLLQFHGDEEPAFCGAFGRPYIKAVPMGEAADVNAYADRFEAAAGLLLDSHSGTQSGGSGERFDWRRIPKTANKPIILAGGLTPENVEQAVRQFRPYAVDVSTGVEAGRGIKDPRRIAEFMRCVERGESGA